MKNRIFCVLLALLCVFCLFSCSDGKKQAADADGDTVSDSISIVGTWKYSLNEGVRDVITEVIVDSRVYVDIYYVFNEDGTGKTYASDNSFNRSFTYEYSEGVISITSDGYTFDQKCSLSGNSLTVHDDEKNDDIVFQKQKGLDNENK